MLVSCNVENSAHVVTQLALNVMCAGTGILALVPCRGALLGAESGEESYRYVGPASTPRGSAGARELLEEHQWTGAEARS